MLTRINKRNFGLIAVYVVINTQGTIKGSIKNNHVEKAFFE